MGFKECFVFVTVISCISAQSFRVCIPSTNTALCQSLDRDDSQAICDPVESRIDCAVKLARGTVDFGVFSEEEVVLLSQHQPNDNRIVGSIRDVQRNTQFAFEAVAVVPASHTNGFEGLRGGKYCHPGLDQNELWSPRVLKTLERLIARTDRCPDVSTDRKTAEELEVDTLSKFFESGCRPGAWSVNATVEADLKSRYPNLCSLCGDNANCTRYTIDMGVAVSGVSNDNRHIQSLECLRRNGNGTVAYVAWQHVRDFFNIRNPQDATAYALMCEDGSLRVLTSEVLAASIAPCSFVKQPWSAIVASTARASEVLTKLGEWWPNGVNPSDNSWRATLYSSIIGGSNARVNFETTPQTPANYTAGSRNITDINASSSCVPARRWCTISSQEQAKCNWIRTAAYTLGIEPFVSCQMRSNVFECLADIRDNSADFIATPSNYGYLSREIYRLTSVKLVQNSRNNPAAFSRVAALVKETSALSDITRFENLRGRRACFPEFGGIAYVAFVRAAHERSIISSSECDYAKAVGEFFSGACAPGAEAASHATQQSTYNVTNLCTACRPSILVNNMNYTCAYDNTNLYYGNNGSISCLVDTANDVTFVEIQNVDAHLVAAGLQPTQVRVLCRNNTLAATTGTNVDQNCLLAYVVDSEVLTRRDDPLTNSLNTLLETLDLYFGYNAATSAQLINLEIYSPFDSTSDLLFKDTAVGLTEPSNSATNEAARNYNELFQHLDSCSSSPPSPGMAARNFYSFLTLFIMTALTRVAMF